ncbi:Ogr/Delta-like zinc finger [compost metagenome]
MTTNTPHALKYCCPDCGSRLIKRTSARQHLLMSKTYLICKNAVCGATFTGIDEITHRLSPPSQPNPDIDLPYASNALRSIMLEAQGILPEPGAPVHLNSNDLEARP